jgi:hypothetical protein
LPDGVADALDTVLSNPTMDNSSGMRDPNTLHATASAILSFAQNVWVRDADCEVFHCLQELIVRSVDLARPNQMAEDAMKHWSGNHGPGIHP